tara:strand:+ start:74207 stop:74491 length:285 start_codon:yes stop_codon:yes gene_type:complete
MAFVTVSNWTMDNYDESMIEVAQQKFVPMIKALGATSVSMVRTGDLSMMVITHYADSQTAKTASEKIDDIRSQAAAEFSMNLESAQAGEVIAGG